MATDCKCKFPLYKNYYKFDLQHVLKISENPFNEIICNKPRELKDAKLFKTTIDKNGKNGSTWNYMFIKDEHEDNEELNLITDYFTMQNRIEATFIGYDSPIEYFNKNYKKILKELDITCDEINNNKLQPIQIILFYTYMRNHVRFTNNFRISIILRVLDIFKPTKWLDISAGWGDRLISAILYPSVKYYMATDPNLALHEGYKNIIEAFNVNPKQYRIKKKGFEMIKLHDYDYDFVFSSPPFFDIEKYSDNDNDSLVKHKTLEKWYYDFLLYSVIKACKHLKNNAFFVLNIIINNHDNREFSNKKLLDDLKKTNLLFCGCIYYYSKNNNKPRELMVYKKVEDIKINDNFLKKKYDNIQ